MIGLQRIQLEGEHYIVLKETEYERLCRKASEGLDDDDLPPFPPPDANGRFPALEYTRISLARDIIRDRRRAGLSQFQLAKLADVRQETISRIETGKQMASIRTVDKIDAALKIALAAKKKGR